MRSGVWLCAVALLAVTTSALRRDSQGEDVSRLSRRQSTSTVVPNTIEKADEVQPTFRRRDSRRGQEKTMPGDSSRNRIRTRTSTTETIPLTSDKLQLKTERNENYDSRRSSARSRRPIVADGNIEVTVKNNNAVQSRTRNTNNRPSAPTSPSTVPTGRGSNKYESLSSTTETIIDSISNSQIKSRTIATTSKSVRSMRSRGRINVQNDTKALDLDVSGTMNTITVVKPTTTRTEDTRNSRKLRYKTRLSEIDTNLTGDGLNPSPDIKSSHVKDGVTSQPQIISSSSSTPSNNDNKNLRRNLKTSSLRTMRLVKRPLLKESVTSNESVIQAKSNKVSDEISEDDNYPESFKALIQAKNGSTDTSSPGESLAVKASQKVFETYTSTSQTINTGSDTDNWRLRDKSKYEHSTTETVILEKQEKISDVSSKQSQVNENNSLNTTTGNQNLGNVASNVNRANRRPYKSGRNIKMTTTDVPRSLKNKEPNTFKKPTRSPIYARRHFDNKVTTETQLKTDDKNNENIKPLITFKPKQTLPRTSYYSRSLKYSKNVTTSTEKSFENSKDFIADKKENSADMPIIFTYLNGRSKQYVDTQNDSVTLAEKPNEPFIITVNSKESHENINDNKTNKLEDIKPMSLEMLTTTQKYHATYKEPKSSNGLENNLITTVSPIKNFQTRKYNRKNGKIIKNEESATISSRSKEKSLRKYSDSYSKTTETSSNGIIAEPEKSKNKFSSKYRASYLDKPFYKPTVPTITSSTAWLKFFVTDSQITKSVEEPQWFEEEDFIGSTTEKMSRQLLPTLEFIFETPINTVEGEEIQLSPEINAISFTKPRSPLTSADLRLSESFMKPSQVMNVEASNHSPSVTVSIFDALADILTSTPKPKISTTTEAFKSQINISDANETLDGVSSNKNVNIVNGITNQTSLISTDILDKTANIVQTTDGATPIVSNHSSIRENVFTTFSSPRTTVPIVIPTTPISQRKPFAIKVLYSETRPTTDNMTAVPTSTIDSSTMVYNTVSDLLLSNNKLVSLELTSMLANNIENIIQTMDDDSKTKLSVDMVKLLNTLIPKAFNRRKTKTDDEELLLNTTPYSMEDLKDTENINVDNSGDIITVKEDISDSNYESRLFNDVNITSTINPLSASEVEYVTDTNFQVQVTSQLKTSTNDLIISGVTSDAELISFGNTNATSLNDSTNNPLPSPFITNYQPGFISNVNDISDNLVSTSSPSSPSLEAIELQNIENIQDPSQLSRLQLWVLSKKARVLKMIEDLIKAHNNEIAIPSLTEIIKQTTDKSFRNRLTEIMTSTDSTTNLDDFKDELTNVLPPTTLSTSLSTPSNLSPTFIPSTTIIFDSGTISTTPQSLFDINNSDTSSIITMTSDKTKADADIISNEEGRFSNEKLIDKFNTLDSDFESTTLKSTIETTTFNKEEYLYSSEPTTSSFDEAILNENSGIKIQNDPLPINDVETTTNLITDTDTTTSPNVESGNGTTSASLRDIELTTDSSTIIENNYDTTTQIVLEKTTNEINDMPTPNSNLQRNVATKPFIPKKDYVIFGILPNNTVVRKDPNDEKLETLTEASPYIIYGVLPNNTIIRKFPNGTRVPRIMQKIDILPISPWSLRNPYSPIHNIPAIVRPQSNPIRVSTNTVTFQDTSNNGTKNRLTTDTVNNHQVTISSSNFNVNDSSSLGITSTIIKMPAEKSTASHVLSLRTTTMLPSFDEILLNSISSAIKEEMAISSVTSSTSEPRILTLDIDPETKQIRTEKPESKNGNTVFKFIPIDEVTVPSEDSNVLKLASAKSSKIVTDNNVQTMTAITESNTQTPQVQIDIDKNDDPTTTLKPTVGTPLENVEQVTVQFPSPVTIDDFTTIRSSNFDSVEAKNNLNFAITTVEPTETINFPTTIFSTSTKDTMTESINPTTLSTSEMPTVQTTTNGQLVTTGLSVSTVVDENVYMSQKDNELLQNILNEMGRNPKMLNYDNKKTSLNQLGQIDNNKLLQALLSREDKPNNELFFNNLNKIDRTTTFRSIDDDIKQFEEDSKLLKSLLLAMGRDPAELNLPNIDFIKLKASGSTTLTSTLLETTTTMPLSSTITIPTTMVTQTTIVPTTPAIVTKTKTANLATNIDEDIKKIQEDTKLLQTLLQLNGNQNKGNLPIISGITSNVKAAPTFLGSDQTTSNDIRPVYVTQASPVYTTPLSGTITLSTLQPQSSSTENIGISTTLKPFNERVTTSQNLLPTSGRSTSNFRNPLFTTEIPSTSTFSDEEDLAFLQNLKSVLGTKSSEEDPETSLANRVIALAVERSLNEIQSGMEQTSTTTMRTTTTTSTTTIKPSTPSIDDDIRQFQEDTKLLQALLKVTGQDPSKLNLPELPHINVSPKVSPTVNEDLNLLSNLLKRPSPLNEPFDPLTQKPGSNFISNGVKTPITTSKPYGAKIAVKDNLKNDQDDAKLLQTLIKLQGVQETTTQRSKLAITGQSSDEALKNLIKQAQPTGMVSEATKPSISLSTEYGNTNDALLAALLKEQGFGPTTASSLDEQLRLAALLNQVVVTPKTPRRTTTPPPPPPPPRRPVLDGLAWLWQQWRETAPGPGAPRPNRRPASTAGPAATQSAATSSRVNWFGSGPFVGNADDRPQSNRIPLDPPSAALPPAPGRGQLVSAAINVTRAFSQFLGAAIQGAAQTVQNVIRAGQRAASDAYTTGSG